MGKINKWITYSFLAALLGAPTNLATAALIDVTSLKVFGAANQSTDLTVSDAGNAIDDNVSTSSFLTPSFTDIAFIAAFDLNGSHFVNRIRVGKPTANIDGTNGTVDSPNLEILFSTDTNADLSLRTYSRVKG